MYSGRYIVRQIDDILAKLYSSGSTSIPEIVLPAIYKSSKGVYKLEVGDVVFIYPPEGNSGTVSLVLALSASETLVFKLNTITGDLNEVVNSSAATCEPDDVIA